MISPQSLTGLTIFLISAPTISFAAANAEVPLAAVGLGGAANLVITSVLSALGGAGLAWLLHRRFKRRVSSQKRQSEARFRTIFENAPVMIDSFDKDGRCILWNRECEKMLGWTYKEVEASDDPLSLAYPDPEVRKKVFETISKADGQFREYEVLAKNGSRRVQLWADFRLPDGTLFSVGHDITDRKISERALAESEEKYRSIFNEARDGIVLIDGETGYIQDCNPEFETQSGRKLDELRDLKIWELRPADEAQSSRELFEDVREKGIGGSTELHFQKPDGTKVPIEFLSRMVTIGGKLYNKSITRDITERRRSERALIESEEKYRGIFNEARDGIVLADDNGFIVDCNAEFEKQTGRTLDVLSGMRVWDLRPPEGVKPAEKLFHDLREKGSIGTSEQVFQKPDGERVIIELRGRKVTVGGVVFNQAITRDITKRKMTEEALRERDARLRLIVEQVPAVLWTTDRDLRITSSVGAGLRGLNLEPNEAVGKSVYEYFQTDDPDFPPIAMHRRVLEGESVKYETIWNKVIFESHTEPLRDNDGNIIGCIGIALDITERKWAEEELKNSQAQLRALATRLQTVREEESANIAREIHDELGQKLTGLRLDLSWVQRRTDASNHELHERMTAMSNWIDETIHTVRRIATQLRPSILDDLSLIGALEWQSQEFQNRTGISCRFESENTEYDLGADSSTAIFRIYQEILTNVARHAGADQVDVKLHKENGTLVLNVQDNGRGVSSDELRSRSALGILGMQERAHVCGGQVLITGEHQKGTNVVVKIPVESQTSDVTEP